MVAKETVPVKQVRLTKDTEDTEQVLRGSPQERIAAEGDVDLTKNDRTAVSPLTTRMGASRLLATALFPPGQLGPEPGGTYGLGAAAARVGRPSPLLLRWCRPCEGGEQRKVCSRVKGVRLLPPLEATALALVGRAWLRHYVQPADFCRGG